MTHRKHPKMEMTRPHSRLAPTILQVRLDPSYLIINDSFILCLLLYGLIVHFEHGDLISTPNVQLTGLSKTLTYCHLFFSHNLSILIGYGMASQAEFPEIILVALMFSIFE